MCSRIQKLTVVLASASPRRTELLEQGNIKHVVMPSHCEEVITSQVPSQVVEELSVQKAEDVYQQYETKNTGDFLVIGSDTVVAADGTILGKPKDKEAGISDDFHASGKSTSGLHRCYASDKEGWEKDPEDIS